jgi:hypothetical protein
MLRISLYMCCVFSKDVRLPIQLQRAMAAEAEATREAKAKVRKTKTLLIVDFRNSIVVSRLNG